MKTYGTAALSKQKRFWLIDAQPHVRMKLKQVFRRIDPEEHGRLKLSATDENCRDLQWFMERFPLEVIGAEELERRARAYDARMETVADIMAGRVELDNTTMAIPPREYQRQAAALVLSSGSLLLADELGLGKTVSAIAVLSRPETLPALVVCPAHLPRQWKKEINRFIPGLKVHLAKKATAYPLADKDGRLPDVIVMSYHKMSGWADELAGHVRTVIYDEVQELRKDTSAKYKAAKHFSERADFRMGLSGTPIYNYGGEFYCVLSALKPGAMGYKDEFFREWCRDSYDKDKAKIKEPKVFGSYLRDQGLMLRRTRADVARELPSLTKIIQQVDCDVRHLRSIESDATELANIILGQQGGMEIMRASSEFSNKLRLATGMAKAPYVAEFVRMLLEQGMPVVLFGWHRVVYEMWQERLGPFRPAWYTGSESVAKKSREVERFLDGDTNLLVMSLRSGAGVDGLQARCSTVVFGELDWSPGAMDQCVGRIHRDGQTAPVHAYYLTAADGADPYMIDALDLKRQQIEGVRDPDQDIVEDLQVDPDHVKKLARAYLAKKGKA